ncbi:MAG TPA: hypothetical protein VFH27_06610, partial [Longimicrobiaceae bacterium]|nr:hypothetical protein [Longimicrobiaceae bacterium]
MVTIAQRLAYAIRAAGASAPKISPRSSNHGGPILEPCAAVSANGVRQESDISAWNFAYGTTSRPNANV